MTAATATRTDYQRSRVYAAEALLDRLLDGQYSCPTVRMYGSNLIVPIERKFADIESMQRYVQRIDPTVQVRKGRTNQRKPYGGPLYGITIPTTTTRYHMRETSLLHELAHAQNSSGDRHGPQFCSRFLTLVQENMGPEAHFLLRAMFYENGVDI